MGIGVFIFCDFFFSSYLVRCFVPFSDFSHYPSCIIVSYRTVFLLSVRTVESSHVAHRRPLRQRLTSCALATTFFTSKQVSIIFVLILFSVCDRFSCQKAFRDVLTEVNDQAGQHEVVSENLTSAVTKEIASLVKDLKEERKKVFIFIVFFLIR